MPSLDERLHATCVAYGERAVLLMGPSGSGKSDLALRAINQPVVLPVGPGREGASETARLVADDQVVLRRDGDRLIARAPDRLAGLLEVRGLGIVRVDFVQEAEIHLVVELVARDAVERMPAAHTRSLLGRALPKIRLHPFESSAVAKLALALCGNVSISL